MANQVSNGLPFLRCQPSSLSPGRTLQTGHKICHVLCQIPSQTVDSVLVTGSGHLLLTVLTLWGFTGGHSPSPGPGFICGMDLAVLSAHTPFLTCSCLDVLSTYHARCPTKPRCEAELSLRSSLRACENQLQGVNELGVVKG